MRNIAVSIVGRTYGEIIEHVTRVMSKVTEVEAEYKDTDIRVGILEFRADYYEKVTEKTELLELLGEVRRIVGDRQLHFIASIRLDVIVGNGGLKRCPFCVAMVCQFAVFVTDGGFLTLLGYGNRTGFCYRRKVLPTLGSLVSIDSTLGHIESSIEERL